MTAIAGKTVFLTGASRGLGVLIARALLQQGATVVGVSRSQPNLEVLGTDLSPRFLPLAFDISEVEQLPKLVHYIRQQVGTIDILVNNAGIEIYREFQHYSTADLRSILNTNLLAAMELSRLLLPQMLERGGGHIVNIASLAGKKGTPYNSVYAASKAGMVMWTDALRQELWGTGVNVSVVCPGFVAEQGMAANTGVPLPHLAGISQPMAVSRAVVDAIQHNRAEVIINQNWMNEFSAKLLLAISIFFPQFGDAVYRWIHLAAMNRLRIQSGHSTQSITLSGEVNGISTPSNARSQ